MNNLYSLRSTIILHYTKVKKEQGETSQKPVFNRVNKA